MVEDFVMLLLALVPPPTMKSRGSGPIFICVPWARKSRVEIVNILAYLWAAQGTGIFLPDSELRE